MVDVTPFLPGLSPVQGKAVVARFDGGRLSSEGGLLVLREVESRLGLPTISLACTMTLLRRTCASAASQFASAVRVAVTWPPPGNTRDTRCSPGMPGSGAHASIGCGSRTGRVSASMMPSPSEMTTIAVAHYVI